LRTYIAAALTAGLVVALSPALAQAASVSAADTPGTTTRVITYSAAASEVNQPTVTREGANIVVRDPSATVGPGGLCAAGADSHTVTCPDGAPTITRVEVTLNLLDGNDSAVVNVPNVTILGGAGKDSLTGSDADSDVIDGQGDEDTVNGRGGNDVISDSIDDGAPNHLSGGPGDDSLTGSSGNDDLHGDAGNDYLVGHSGADLLDGGPGFDTASYADRDAAAASGVSVTLSGGAASGAGAPGENDTLAAIENLAGSAKNDALVGDAGPNVIQGLDGDDAISGGAGSDILYGGAGNDSIDAVDQAVDTVSCGGPQAGDTASVDDVDAVADCPAPGAGLSITAVPPRSRPTRRRRASASPTPRR
jgi:Ca2+-binding RTX toxin-like protein